METNANGKRCIEICSSSSSDEEENVNTKAFLTVNAVEGERIDQEKNPKPTSGDNAPFYSVIFRVEPNPTTEDQTVKKWKSIDGRYLNWYHIGAKFPIDNNLLRKYHDAFLILEIVRDNRKVCDDVGTSTGFKVVGRARFPIPKKFSPVNQRWSRWVRVIGANRGDEAAGIIRVNMNLRKDTVEPREGHDCQTIELD